MSYEKQKRPGTRIDSIDFSATVVGHDFSNSQIEWCRAKGVTFKSCNFSSAYIKSCYFHEARFQDCDFTGCAIVESNLRNAKMVGCDLRYLAIRNSFIEVASILDNLPAWENVQRDLLRTARRNAESQGDIEAARLFLKAEMAASEEHWRNAVRRTTKYYRDHYPGFLGKVTSFLRMWGLRLGNWFWGHGESPLKLGLVLGVWLCLWIAVASRWSTNSVWEASQQVISAFLGVAYSVDHSMLGKMELFALSGSRFVFFGLFITVFVRRFSKR